MIALDFILNGRYTRSRDFVTSLVSASSPASNYWSSSENSRLNAWNVNFSSGNVNNNNKYNPNYVRAVAALDSKIKEGWIAAFEDCCRNKFTSGQCVYYRQFLTRDLMDLAVEVEARRYTPSASFTFVVTRPRLREIFAANFRDRIAQHWITLRLNPLFEDLFESQGNVSYNCRKGFGTARCVGDLSFKMEAVSAGYTRPAWVGKFDIRSCFMTIDKRILWRRLRSFILERYKGDDIDTLLYLTRVTVFHCPQDACIRRSRPELWEQLPRHKSLFGSDPMVGMPIGNITSQLFANFYLSVLDAAMNDACARMGAGYIRFVDDFSVVAPRKEDVLELRRIAAHVLKDDLNMTLHEDKVYVQPARHGVKMVGQVIRPGRRYLSNRTFGSFANEISQASKACRKVLRFGRSESRIRSLEHHYSALNSYLGFCVGTASYNIRRKLFRKMATPEFWKVFRVSAGLRTVHLSKKYSLKTMSKP